MYLHELSFLNTEMMQADETLSRATQGARTSAAIVLTQLLWNYLLSMPERITLFVGAVFVCLFVCLFLVG